MFGKPVGAAVAVRVPLKMRPMAWLALLAGALALFMAYPAWRAAADTDVATIQQLRVGQQPGGAMRLVLEYAPQVPEEQLKYRWFTLPKPARVVVDFPAVSFADSPNFIKLPEGGIVTSLRAGRFRPDTVRMVMDLTKPSMVSMFTIPPKESGKTPRGQRLVIDIAPVKKGQKPTDVPPPADVVDEGTAPNTQPISIEDEPAPVVPAQVVNSRKGTRTVVVALDPGHGGVDPGACGRVLKLCEKNLVLDVAHMVRERLEDENIKVVMTREDDRFIPLAERVKIAQRAQSDLFISIHADSHPSNRNVIGATTYVVSDKASDREAQRLADNENEGDILAGIAIARESREVQNILISLVQRETRNNSSYLAQSILAEMGKVTEVRKTEPLFAGFRVLKAPDVPSVLIEMGYLSNAKEERQLASKSFRKKLAARIAAGIMAHVREHVHY